MKRLVHVYRKIESVTHGCIGLCLYRHSRDILGNSYVGEYVRGVLSPERYYQREFDSRRMGVTHTFECLWMIAIDAVIGHVEVVRVLDSTWPGNTADRPRYILPIMFRLAISGSGQDLWRDALINEDL